VSAPPNRGRGSSSAGQDRRQVDDATKIDHPNQNLRRNQNGVPSDRVDGDSGEADPYIHIDKMLAELRAERESFEEAIVILERLQMGRGKRRGRPPLWLSEVRRREEAAAESAPPKHKVN
jgi:hypothetical protein